MPSEATSSDGTIMPETNVDQHNNVHSKDTSHGQPGHVHTSLCDSRRIPVPQSARTVDHIDYTSLLPQLQSQGYVVIRSILPKHLLLATQATSKYLVQRARTGSFWPYVRTVGKQYPPWPEFDVKAAKARGRRVTDESEVADIWGIQHLLHPDLGYLRSVYAEVYFSDAVIGVVQHLLAQPSTAQAVPEDELCLELCNLLVSPTRQGFELEWHRDDIRPDLSPEEEVAELQSKTPGGQQAHAQYNLALTGDSSLIVIPGSHLRARTETERNAGKYDELPGQTIVQLDPGDAVFYDSNLLHRGVYEKIDPSEDLGRMTVHASVGLNGFGRERARQVLQHGVSWVEQDEVEGFGIEDETRKKRAEEMKRCLLRLGKESGEVGYSLDG